MTGSIFPTGAIDVTPSANEFSTPCWGIRCNGVAGNVEFVDGYGRKHLWPIAAGETIPIQVKAILATNTTATLLSTYQL